MKSKLQEVRNAHDYGVHNISYYFFDIIQVSIQNLGPDM